MCLCVYVFMCVRFYVSMCLRVRVYMWLYMAGVCLFVICMRHLCVCLLVRVCVRVRVWLRFLFRQELEATHTGRQRGHIQRQDDRHTQHIEKTRLRVQIRVHDHQCYMEIVEQMVTQMVTQMARQIAIQIVILIVIQMVKQMVTQMVS